MTRPLKLFTITTSRDYNNNIIENVNFQFHRLLYLNQIVIAKRNKLLDPWTMATVESQTDQYHFSVKFNDGETKVLALAELADGYGTRERCQVGKRIICKSNDVNAEKNGNFHVGIIAELPSLKNHSRFVCY